MNQDQLLKQQATRTLLEELLNAIPATPAPAPAPSIALPAPTVVVESVSQPVETRTATQKIVKPVVQKQGPTLYDKLMVSLVDAGLLIFGFGMWWIGAQFTLAFAASIGIPVAKLGVAQWLLPAIITAIEIKCWPNKTLDWHHLSIFGIIAIVDLFTSTVGGKAWLAGRMIAEWRLPSDGTVIWLIALVASIAFAFWPERLTRSAVRSLLKTWR